MTFEVWAGAALLVALAVLYGRALSALGAPSWAAGPALGFGIELIAAEIGSELPGVAYTGAGILLLLALAALAVCVWRRDRPNWDVVPWVVLVVGVLLCDLPFISQGRTGLLGVSLDNDTAAHLTYAAALASTSVAHVLPAPTAYPLAPHALAAALTDGTGIRLDAAFDSFTIAAMLVTALVGASAVGRESWWRRVVAGTMIAFFYLESAYYGEDSFKELILGMLLTGFVLCLEGARECWSSREGARWPLLIPLAVLFAAGLYTYGYLAAAWYVLTLVLWLIAELAANYRSFPTWRARWREFVVPAVIAIAAAIILLLPITGRLLDLVTVFGVSPSKAITVTNLGDLSGAISPYEAFGIWQSLDFRSDPTNLFHAGELGAFAFAVLLYGFARTIAQRRFAVAAGVGACALIYFASAHGQSSYVTAKSLTIASPLVALVVMRGLLGTTGLPLSVPAEWLRRIVSVIFVAFGLWSSALVLRAEPVWPMTGPDELLSFSRLTHGSSVLLLAPTGYASWIFDRSTTVANGPTPGFTSSTKPAAANLAMDWDNVSTAGLNHYQWVVTANTPNASQAPPSFRLVRRMRMYELWRRVSTTTQRESLESSDYPGAVLDCRDAHDRHISRLQGVASVMPQPIAAGVGVMLPGQSRQVSIRLPAGRWELSMQYVSGVAVQVSEPGVVSFKAPAYLDGIGPFFAIGQVASHGGPTPLVVHASKPSFLTPAAAFLGAQVEAIVANRIPDTRTVLPLRKACGRYVDWYRTTSS